jgi:hypothetical protein
MSFYSELKRRNVLRFALLYIIASWLTLQVVHLVLAIRGGPDWLFGALIGAAVLGFIPALVLSWVYELTPEGIKRDSEVDPSRSLREEHGERLNVAIILLLIGAVLAVIADRVGPAGPQGEPPVPVEEPAPPKD